MLDRFKVRGRLIAKSRRDWRNQPLCWVPGCNHIGAHMHEMVNRNVTVGNDAARLLSFQEGVCVLICPEHHEQAPTRQLEETLWRVLYEKYGQNFVRTAYDAINREMRGELTIPLPD